MCAPASQTSQKYLHGGNARIAGPRQGASASGLAVLGALQKKTQHLNLKRLVFLSFLCQK
jgi:hypothetical protein